MTVSVRRLIISSLALGTISLAACGNDPVSPKAAKAPGTVSTDVFQGSSS